MFCNVGECMKKLREALRDKMNIMRLVSVSIVMMVVIMLCFAMQIEVKEDQKKKKNEKEIDRIEQRIENVGDIAEDPSRYDNAIQGADYCIVVDADEKKIYVTTKWTDLTDDADQTEKVSSLFTIEDAIENAKDDPTACDGSGEDALVDLNVISSDVSLGNSTLDVDTKNEILEAITFGTSNTVPKIIVNSLYFSTSVGNSFALRAGNTSGIIPDENIGSEVDNGVSIEYDTNNKNNTHELCYVEGMRNGNSDKYNGVRIGCGIYIKGDAIVEFNGESLIEIADTAGRSGNVNTNSGKIEACYGIYGTGDLTLVEGNEGKLNIEYDAMPYYNPNGKSGGLFNTYINMYNYAVYCYGVFAKSNMTVECDVCIATTRECEPTDSKRRKRVYTRGFYGLVVQKGDITVNKGKIDIINDNEVVVYSSTVSSDVTSKKVLHMIVLQCLEV